MSWLTVALILFAVAGVALQFWAFVRECFAFAASCTCRKGAVNRECPIHGRSR